MPPVKKERMAPVQLPHPSEAVASATISAAPKPPKAIRTKFAALLDEDALKVQNASHYTLAQHRHREYHFDYAKAGAILYHSIQCL